MTTTISKAEQTRLRQATEHINANLRRKLTDFENDYLNHAANWAVRKIEIEIKEWEVAIEKVDKNKRGWEVTIQNRRSPDWSLQLDSMKSESIVS